MGKISTDLIKIPATNLGYWEVRHWLDGDECWRLVASGESIRDRVTGAEVNLADDSPVNRSRA